VRARQRRGKTSSKSLHPPAHYAPLSSSFAEGDVRKVVSVSLDGRESQLVFIDHAHVDMGVSLSERILAALHRKLTARHGRRRNDKLAQQKKCTKANSLSLLSFPCVHVRFDTVLHACSNNIVT